MPFTRAGCDFGAVATANTILENTAIDIPTVFGAGSPEAAEVVSNPGQAFADFVGIGVHCAQGSAVCTAQNSGRPDLLPDEPGGYSGFNGLFGAKYVNPIIKPGGPMIDLDGNVIQDSMGHIGFPGFDGMEATVSLSWVAQMQEAGIPVTYAYISDAHDGHGTSGNIHFAYGPGETGYVLQLQAYDQTFQKFFDRLAADGIDKSNTLFVFTVDGRRRPLRRRCADSCRLRRGDDAVHVQPRGRDQCRPAAHGLHSIRRLDPFLSSLR